MIGKDILRFHTIYWPIMLMALGVPLPKQVFGHPWLLIGEGKMSKSKGNVIYADDLVDLFGVDAVRYYVLREIPFAQDGSLTYELLIERINGELVNILGNLVNRTAAMTQQYFDGVIPTPNAPEEIDNELIAMAEELPKIVAEKMDELRVADSIQAIFNVLRRSNKYIDETTPWLLAKEPDKKDRLGTVLYNLLESIRISAVLLSAFLPDTAEKILTILNTEVASYDSTLQFGGLLSDQKLNPASILFERIDANKKMKEIENSFKKEKKEKKSEEVKNIAEEITIDDFAKVHLITGEIISAEKHPDADKLYVLQVQTGDEQRQIVSGIAKHFSLEELPGKKVVVVANLKPAKLRGVMSYGMLLMAEDKKKLAFISAESEIKNGSKIR